MAERLLADAALFLVDDVLWDNKCCVIAGRLALLLADPALFWLVLALLLVFTAAVFGIIIVATVATVAVMPLAPNHPPRHQAIIYFAPTQNVFNVFLILMWQAGVGPLHPGVLRPQRGDGRVHIPGC